MPLFRYVCKKCDHDFEELVFGSEEVECPECHGKKLERQTSMPGLPQVKNGAAMSSGCGDLSLPPCGAVGCRRTGKA
jgi:putative FmdB family regulatory protein